VKKEGLGLDVVLSFYFPYRYYGVPGDSNSTNGAKGALPRSLSSNLHGLKWGIGVHALPQKDMPSLLRQIICLWGQ